MRRLSGILVGGLLVVMTAAPAFGQADAWQRKWYWGAQTGAFFYSTPAGGSDIAITAGGHWLITGRRSGFHITIDQIFFPNGSTGQIADATSATGTRDVQFGSGRRLQASLLAIPSNNKLQVMLGGGFAINQVTDAAAVGTTDARVRENVESAASRAFFVLTAGFQWRLGTRWAFYGDYNFMPASNKFLITSTQHVITTGLRVAIGASHEEVTTQPD